MGDINIKTVTLTGGEVEVTFTRKHCHIRNLGGDTIYASITPGIVADADGVLGIPSGAVDVLHNTDGKVYVKGTGKVQLVGSDYADGILGAVVGDSELDKKVAAEVAKLIADAPEDFDTLKEISDWITTHSDSAAEMNSEIQTLKTEKANKTEIPTSLPANGGNSNTVNNHTVESDVPAGAVFTDTTYNNATTSTDGLMSSEDKLALDSAVQTIQVNGVAQPKNNGVVNITISDGGGSADTATKLETARSITVDLASSTAASFDGSEDITPGVSGILPVANGGTGNSTGYVTVGQNLDKPLGRGATSEGRLTIAKGFYSHAEGNCTTANHDYSHAEGYATIAQGGYGCHAEGYYTKTDSIGAHAEGDHTYALGTSAHAEGKYTNAYGHHSHTGGLYTYAKTACLTAIGKYNVYDDTDLISDIVSLLVVGNGTEETARSNAFRVHSDSTVYGGTYNSSGADYAEYFEWLDGNLDNEDRRGRFVTLYGNKIGFANASDNFVLGIVSGNPSVIGDAHDDQWRQMYLTDIFGSPIFEDVDIPDELDEEGNIITPAHSEHRMKLNPDYDNNQTYIPRSKRPEWSAVGMMGKLVVVDDGTCAVDGWCTPSTDGVGTRSSSITRYRVMERIDDTHVLVIVI